MKIRIIVSTLIVFLIALIIQLIVNKVSVKQKFIGELITDGDEKEEKMAAYQYLRWKYEADLIKDPATGQIPFGMREQEIEFAKTIPVRGSSSSTSRVTVQNNYLPAGPNNIGGRTRALAYDNRYNGTTNRVIIAGCISGGIYRSADGGANWVRVTPANEVHNVACVVQDPRTGNQDTWYAGGGEYVGSSTDAPGAGYLGYGLFKSTDNGVTWVRLPLNTITDINGSLLPSGVPERFDHPFDYVHKIAVNPLNGDVYVAGHRRVMRSKDGGSTFQTVLGSTVSAFAANGQCDVTVSPTGKVYAAITGSTADFSLRGIWRSNTGNQNSFTRMAGGSVLGTDSVANWRGNAYDFFVSGGSNFYDTRRTLITLAPSNENILYVLYENGLSNASPNFDKEADLFKLDMSSGNNWTNLSANLPDFSGGNLEATDPFAIQDGYDLFITVKPNDPNFVIIGGTSLYRSTNGFSSPTNTAWIGGYGNTLPDVSLYGQTNFGGDPSKWSHPDIHNLVFNPSNFNEAICANDGGIQMTSNIAATSGAEPVTWNVIKNYQTLQYFRITIDPEIGANNFAGGAQDNGTQFRDKTGLVGVAIADSNNHRRIMTGDGGSVGISKRVNSTQVFYGSIQLGSIRRGVLQSQFSSEVIRPNGLTPASSGSTTEFGDFVTNFKLDPDNTDDLYYVNFNRLFRTTSASTVSSSSGWTEMTGVSSAVNSSNGTNISIRALALSRGAYTSTHCLYMGTSDGKIFRLDGPRNSVAGTIPVNISPPGISGLNVQDIAVNPNNDNEILVAITNYGITSGSNFDNVVNIWWTNNAKSASPTWFAAEGNLAGNTTSGFISARSCMIVVKKDATNTPVTEYYVGTSAGLFSVENLGTTLTANGTPAWQRESSAVLNFSVINSLAYRPTDNVMAIGTHGNGLFYTFLGTPNLVTAVTDPIINDKTFIASVFPTVSDNVVQYRIGNRFEVKKISVQLLNMQGQVVYKKQENYSNGSFNLERFPKGIYILSIYSDNQQYKHVQKLIH